MLAAQPMDLTAELAEVLRWREMEWSCIPPLSRKLVMPYLGAGDTINLDTAVTNKEDRKHLVKAYVGLRSAGLDEYAHYRVDLNGVCLGVNGPRSGLSTCATSAWSTRVRRRIRTGCCIL